MWVVVHTATGLALGAALGPPGADLPLWLLLAAALLLHLLLDLVPHWDYTQSHRRTLWAALDLAGAAAVLVLGAARWGLPAATLLAAVVSAAPDLDVLDALRSTGPRRRFFPSHWAGFPHGHASKAVGIPLQLVVTVASLLAAYLFSQG